MQINIRIVIIKTIMNLKRKKIVLSCWVVHIGDILHCTGNIRSGRAGVACKAHPTPLATPMRGYLSDVIDHAHACRTKGLRWLKCGSHEWQHMPLTCILQLAQYWNLNMIQAIVWRFAYNIQIRESTVFQI